MLFNHLGGDLIHTELHHLRSMYMMTSLSSIIKWQKCLRNTECACKFSIRWLLISLEVFGGQEEGKEKMIISVTSFTSAVPPTSSQGMTMLCVSLEETAFINPCPFTLPTHRSHSTESAMWLKDFFARILYIWIFVTYIFVVWCHSPLATQGFNLNRD